MHLSPSCPPHAPLQAACLLTGVRWAASAPLLATGLELTLFVSTGAIEVKLRRMPKRVVWAAAAEAPAPCRAILGIPGITRRTRQGTALHPTRAPTLLSSCTYAADLSSNEDVSDSDSCSEYSSDLDDRFLYAGGTTHVISGGVMLGSRASSGYSASTPIANRPAPARPFGVGLPFAAIKPAASWRKSCPARDRHSCQLAARAYF
ncbi:hypothetical protein FB451DRAFT_1400507 [Mycena latifolia]|nr:hypothetical protein FB451DRAFT_1400507 [Mycena latifolia]